MRAVCGGLEGAVWDTVSGVGFRAVRWECG